MFLVTYDSELWTLTLEEERVLAVFERKVLRKIYGSVQDLWNENSIQFSEIKQIMENLMK
jgi:hypothetical protein